MWHNALDRRQDIELQEVGNGHISKVYTVQVGCI